MHPSPTPGVPPPGGDADEALLRRLGYAQELRRRMSGFSNFALSFSIICILAGGITSFQLGFGAVGGAAAGIVWPAGVAYCLIVALCLAQVASAFPTAGGLYHWSALLGGRGWGWATAWFNLLGLVFVTASVNVGATQLLLAFAAPLAGVDPATLGPGVQAAVVGAITLTQAACNHFGIRLVTRLTDLSGVRILVVAVVLTVALLAAAPALDWGRLVRFANHSGAAGGGIWPPEESLSRLAALALIWPLYTITGYDASAHAAEETREAARNVPRGIVRSVLLSGGFGWVMVAAFVLALPDVGAGAAKGAEVFSWLLSSTLPTPLATALWAGIIAANYCCGLACVTSTSRMIYAFARDGGLPAAGTLRRVSPRWGTPVAAVWVGASLAFACTLYTPVYSTLTAGAVIFIYVSYLMPILAGLRACGGSWRRMGPFDLGVGRFRLLALLALTGGVGVVWVGIQPPNDAALPLAAGAALLLALLWWGGVRRRFPGPPVAALTPD
jgi:amino acid transporter